MIYSPRSEGPGIFLRKKGAYPDIDQYLVAAYGGIGACRGQRGHRLVDHQTPEREMGGVGRLGVVTRPDPLRRHPGAGHRVYSRWPIKLSSPGINKRQGDAQSSALPF